MSLASAVRELAPYGDEPKQLPSGSFGKSPYLRLGFETRGERSVLATLHRRAPFIVQQALYWDEALPGLPCVCIISNAGGILQGDRCTIEIDLAPGSRAHITTQSATRIHEMDANYATQVQDIRAGAGAYLEYVPHQVIPHRGSRFAQETRFEVDPSATIVYAEILTAGRKHYATGEIFAYDLFSSSLRATRPDGDLLFAEKFVLQPAHVSAVRLGVMGPFHVFGNLVVLTPPEHAERLFAASEARYDEAADVACGVSRLPHEAGLIFRVLGYEAAPVAKHIRAIWARVREQVVGAQLPDRFLWA